VKTKKMSSALRLRFPALTLLLEQGCFWLATSNTG